MSEVDEKHVFKRKGVERYAHLIYQWTTVNYYELRLLCLFSEQEIFLVLIYVDLSLSTKSVFLNTCLSSYLSRTVYN